MAVKQSTCSVETCELLASPKAGAGMCQMHYNAFMRHGDPFGKKCVTCGRYLREVFTKPSGSFCSDNCKPRCSVAGCSGPARKLEMCGAHYAHALRRGSPNEPYREHRGAVGDPCLWCGNPVPNTSQFCSAGCRGSEGKSRAGGESKPRVGWRCERCGEPIDASARGKSGRRVRSDVLMCGYCRRAKYTRHKYSVSVLAQRDGSNCGICGKPVDLALRMPDLLSASVDHIFPFARGGTHEPSNLQLAHNICNRKKSATIKT